MEVFSTVWVILMLYCTEWFGIRQCFAVPVPTLTNYRQGYYSKNSWSYRQTRYPDTKTEQLVFPSKQQEDIPSVAEFSGFGGRGGGGESSSKIFFPDEIPLSSSDKGYHYSDSRVAAPIWQTHHRPSTAVSSSHNKWPTLDQMMNMQQSSEDGSIQTASAASEAPRQQLPDNGKYGNTNTELEIDDQDGFSFKTPLDLSSSTTTPKATQTERVQEAVQEFYNWLKLTRDHQKSRQNKLCSGQSQTGSAAENDNQGLNKPENSFISDQSLVAGLKDSKCPEGQIRLENGECRVKVEI